jgi:hypothetical protein
MIAENKETERKDMMAENKETERKDMMAENKETERKDTEVALVFVRRSFVHLILGLHS